MCFFLGLVDRQKKNDVGKKVELFLQVTDLDYKLSERFCIKKEEKRTLIICCSAKVLSIIDYLFSLFFPGF